MLYLKIEQTLADPYAEPMWVQDVERARYFDTRERAEAAKVRVVDASRINHDDLEDHWYVVKLEPSI